jgi:serine O-acetyltransferase
MFFERSAQKAVIEKDMDRWLYRYKLEQRELKRLGSSYRDNLGLLIQTYPEFRNLFYYRIGYFHKSSGKLLLKLAKTLYKPLDTLIIDVPVIGPGLYIQHGICSLIGAKEIGENCWINQQVTIGYKEDGYPILGNNVKIAPGAKVLGGITIGDNSVVGANAVVVKNVPPNCTVVGVPAYIIKRDGIKVKEPLK